MKDYYEYDRADLDEIAKLAGYHKIGWPAASICIALIVFVLVLALTVIYQDHTIKVDVSTNVSIEPPPS